MKKMITRMGLVALTFLSFSAAATAQDKVEGTVSADIVNQYIWRGQKLDGFSIQPTLGVAYKGLSLTAWGSAPLDKEANNELDLTLAYATGGFNIGVTDYWFSTSKDPRYFYYNAHETAHIFEANIGYDFGVASLQWYTNFAGDDYKTDDKGELKHAYSSYVELAAPFKLGGLDWSAAVGAVPYKSSGVYGNVDGFAVTNVSLKATKDIAVTPSFNLPVFAGISANPHDQKAYLIVGITLKP